MQVWTNSEPLSLPVAFAEVRRLDLEFLSVRRDSGSFTAFVFLNVEDLPPDAGPEHPRFAGSFSIFAPEQCWGSEGHCDYSRERVSAFDRRPPHHLTPVNISMDVTSAIRRLGDPDSLTVTVHAAKRSAPDQTEGVLRFEHLTALAYQ